MAQDTGLIQVSASSSRLVTTCVSSPRRLARRIAVLIAGVSLFGCVALTSALAGDAAIPAIIGFSKDGRYFAFEEYGTIDASIHPYSSIFVIDLNTGRAMIGSPFAVQWDREGPEEEARAEARKQAAPLLAKLNIGEQPSAQVIDNAAHLFDAPTPDRAYEIRAAEGQTLQIGDVLSKGVIKVKIKALNSASSACAAAGRSDAKNFALLRALAGKPLETVYVDRPAGTERGCSERNGLNALYAYMPPDKGEPRLVALVSYWPHRWEEPDRRYLAIPVPLR